MKFSTGTITTAILWALNREENTNMKLLHWRLVQTGKYAYDWVVFRFFLYIINVFGILKEALGNKCQLKYRERKEFYFFWSQFFMLWIMLWIMFTSAVLIFFISIGNIYKHATIYSSHCLNVTWTKSSKSSITLVILIYADESLCLFKSHLFHVNWRSLQCFALYQSARFLGKMGKSLG